MINRGKCRSCCSWVLRRLSLSPDVSIDGDRTDFAFSPWCTYCNGMCCRCIYLAYRWALVIYFLPWLVYKGTDEGPRFFIFLTEWSYLAWCCYLIISAISTSIGIIQMSCSCCDSKAHTERARINFPESRARINFPKGSHEKCGTVGTSATSTPGDKDVDEPSQQAGSGEYETPPSSQHSEVLRSDDDNRRSGTQPIVDHVEIPQQNMGGVIVKAQWLYHKVHWVLFYVAITSALFVTSLFWLVVYGVSQDVKKSELTAGIYQVHGVNAFFAVLDIILTGIPIRALHVVFPVCFSAGYAVFSVIYYSAHGTGAEGNRYVYSALDWSKPGLAIGVLLSSVVIESIVYVFMYLLYRLRENLVPQGQQSHT